MKQTLKAATALFFLAELLGFGCTKNDLNSNDLETVMEATVNVSEALGPVLTRGKPENTEVDTIFALEGSTITFSVTGVASQGNMSGVEWYNNDFIGAESFSPTGNKTVSRVITFSSLGVFNVSCVAFDSNGQYGNGIKWVVKVVPKTRTAYIDWSDEIIGTDAAENELLRWAAANKITGFSMYVPSITMTNNHQEINSFIGKAKAAGISEIGIVLGNAAQDLTAALTYYDDPQVVHKFTGFVTEIEYWGDDYDNQLRLYLEAIATMKAASDARGGKIKVESYNGGGISQAEADELCKYLDKVLLVCYTSFTDPQSVYYTYRRDRLQYFLNGAVNNNRRVEISPLFSYEPNFGGGKSLDVIDNSFLDGFKSDQDLNNKYKKATLTGTQYFTYFYLNPSKIYVPRQNYHTANGSFAKEITVSVGTTVAFSTQGNDQDGDFNGADWYVNGALNGQQNIAATKEGVVNHNMTFNTAGNYTVQARLHDAKGNYTPLTYLADIVVHVQ